jgi:outer membrane protein TolC
MSKLYPQRAWVLGLVSSLYASTLLAAPLPQPLSLADALTIALDENHYDLQLRAADMEVARAGMLTAQGESDLIVDATLRARYIDPANLSADQSNDDSAAIIVAHKRLFDFGRSNALEHAAQATIESEEQRMALAQQQRKLDVTRAFYGVLLADLAFAWANEHMAIVYVDFDKVKDRRELGKLSQVDLLGAQTKYEEALRERSLAESHQRTTRVKLAAALGDVTQLPSKLVEPKLDGLDARKTPEIDPLVQDALTNNQLLLALRHQLEAATSRVEAVRAKGKPVIDAVVEGGAYQRPVGSNDPFRAGLVMNVPIMSGGTLGGEISRAEAERRRTSAQIVRAEAELRQRITELALEIDVLRKTASGDKVRADYRDIYLERSRALYEMEVSTDLGDSMVQMTDARLRTMRTLYALSLDWAELDALLGHTVDPLAKTAAMPAKGNP